MARFSRLGLLLGALLIAESAASAALLTVSSSADSGAGTLRLALTEVNASAGGDVVDFMIAGPPITITLFSPLPTITENVTIDGTSETDYAGITLITIDTSMTGAGNVGTAFTVANGITATIEAINVIPASTPEPSTALLFCAGLLSVGFLRALWGGRPRPRQTPWSGCSRGR